MSDVRGLVPSPTPRERRSEADLVRQIRELQAQVADLLARVEALENP